MISENGLYGLVSGVLTTALLQPFENIKMALMIPPKNLTLQGNFLSNIGTSSKYIYQIDGYKGFYKGMMAATGKAALGCYTFFTTLKYLQKQEQKAAHNFFHSSFARIVSSIVTNPLSIIQTRFELADFHEYTSVHGAVKQIYQQQGIKGFFSGGLTSCIKEGFFAGLYYMMYEQLKDRQINKFTAGIFAGMIATSITHPFQLIRARLQTFGLSKQHVRTKHMLMDQLKVLKISGQWMKGLAPRLIKKPLANTLTFVLFEIIDQFQDKKQKQSTI